MEMKSLRLIEDFMEHENKKMAYYKNHKQRDEVLLENLTLTKKLKAERNTRLTNLRYMYIWMGGGGGKLKGFAKDYKGYEIVERHNRSCRI